MDKQPDYLIRLRPLDESESDADRRLRTLLIHLMRNGMRCVEVERVEPVSTPIAHVINTPAFAAAWERWLIHLNRQGLCLNPADAESLLDDIEHFGDLAAIRAIKHGIESGDTVLDLERFNRSQHRKRRRKTENQ